MNGSSHFYSAVCGHVLMNIQFWTMPGPALLLGAKAGCLGPWSQVAYPR